MVLLIGWSCTVITFTSGGGGAAGGASLPHAASNAHTAIDETAIFIGK
jgi:hypothetical protein